MFLRSMINVATGNYTKAIEETTQLLRLNPNAGAPRALLSQAFRLNGAV